jgi:hypothetical protein
MGCPIPTNIADFKKAMNKGMDIYNKASSAMSGKYSDKSQLVCIGYEELTGIGNADFKTFCDAVDSSDDVNAIIDKAGLTDTAAGATSKMKEFLGLLKDPSPKVARKLAGLMLCSGDLEEKGNYLFKLFGGGDSEAPGDKVKPILVAAMTIAVKIIPEQAGSDAAKDYKVDPQHHVRNWFRESFHRPVKKDTIVAWVKASNLFPAEVRDQALKALIVEVPKRTEGEADREAASGIASGLSAASGQLEAPKPKKKYRVEACVQCQYFAEDLDLDEVKVDSLFAGAEYYKPSGDKGDFDETTMNRVWERIGQKKLLDTKENKLKEFLTAVVTGKQNPYQWIQMFALLFCPGDLTAKFDLFLMMVTHRDPNRKTIDGALLETVLVDCVKIAAYEILPFAKVDKDMFRGVDPKAAAQLWWSGKEAPIAAAVKYEDLKKWFVDEAKFDPREARENAMKKLK